MTPPGGSRRGRALARGRRVWPLLMMAYERWQALPPEKKEQYTRQAREYATRARTAVEKRRGNRGR